MARFSKESLASKIAQGLVNCGVVSTKVDDPWLMGPCLAIAGNLIVEFGLESPALIDPDQEARLREIVREELGRQHGDLAKTLEGLVLDGRPISKPAEPAPQGGRDA